jgi:hypothetical protein
MLTSKVYPVFDLVLREDGAGQRKLALRFWGGSPHGFPGRLTAFPQDA